MKKRLVCILTAVALVVALLGVGVIAFAQQTDQVTKDGLTVSVHTDKEAYSSDETICLSVSVLNTGDMTAQVNAQVDVSSSLEVKKDLSRSKASVSPGEEDVLQLQIGEISLWKALLPWVLGGVAAIGGVVSVVLLLRKKKRGVVSAALCLLLAGAAVVSAVPVQAADTGEISLSCNVLVDGAPVKLQVQLTYEMVDAVYTRQSLENALVASAWAYFLKEEKLQYCSQEITDGLSKYTGGNYRLTEDAAPEYGTDDTTIYSVCSDFVYKVYYEALGHRLLGAENYLGATTSDFWLKSEDVALMRWIQAIYEMGELDAKYGVTRKKEMNTEQARKFMENWDENLRPGDVICFTGHAFLYVGNGYVMDCWGDKYVESTGLDTMEGMGGVHVLHTVEGLFLNGQDPITQSHRIMYNSTKEWLVVFRPLDAFVQEADSSNPGKDIMSMSALTENEQKLNVTRSRQETPAMEINRTVDITPYGTVASGEKLTYSVAVSNKSNDPDYLTYRHFNDADYAGQTYNGLVVTEKLPEGTVLVEGSISNGGVYENGTITWQLTIEAGQTADLTYQVQVTAPAGSEIVSEGGFVGEIPSNTIKNTVGGKKLSDQAVSGLTALAETPTAQWRENYNISKLGADLEFAERVYQSAMGVDLELPTVEEILNNFYTFGLVENESCSDRFPGTARAWLYTQKETVSQEYTQIQKMMVAGYYGGQKLYTPQRGLTINEFNFDYLEPGDILAYAMLSRTGQLLRTEVSVYVGDGTLLVMDSRQRAEVLHTTTLNNADHSYAKIWNALSRDMFFVLRPSQAYEDINTMVYDSNNEPVYGKEPPEYVNPLGGYTLDEKYLKALAALDAELNEDGTNQYLNKNMNFAEEVYQRIGLDITSVTQGVSIATILKTAVFFDADGMEIAPYSYNFLATPADNYNQLASMLVRELRGGPHMQGYEDNLITISDLVPGDVLSLVNREDSRYWVCIYQGDGKLLTSEYTKGSRQTYKVYDFSQDTDGAEFKDFITKSAIGNFPWECFYVFRPSQGFYNINDPSYDPNYETPDITTGSYAILARMGDEYYALKGDTDKYKVEATKVEYKDGVIIGEADTWSVNVLKEFGTGLGVSISHDGRYIYEKERDVSNISLRSGPSDKTTWRLIYDPYMECYRLQCQSGDNRFLMYSTENTGFKAYADENALQTGELLFVPVNTFDLTSGEYAVIAKAGDKYYAMNGTMRDKVTVGALEVKPSGSGFAGKDVETWKLVAVGSNGNITLRNSEGEYLTRSANSANLGLGDRATRWAVAKDTETGYYTLRNTNGDVRFLSYNGTGFKAYSKATESRFTELLLVPASKISGLLSADLETNIQLDQSYYAMVAVVGDKYYAMSDSGDGYSMNAMEVTVADGKLVTENVPGWNITVQDDKGTVTLATGAGKYLTRNDGSSNIKLTGSEATWTMVRRKSTGYYTITSKNTDKRYLSYNGTAFKAYEKASDEHIVNFLLLPVDPFAQLADGDYAVIAKAGDQYFAMGSDLLPDGVTMGAVQLQENDGVFTGAGTGTWSLKFLDKAGTVSLSNKTGMYLGRQTGSSNLNASETETGWTLHKDSASGYYTLRNTNDDTRYLSYNGTGFKAYAAANDSRFIELLLVPADQIVKPETKLESGYYALVAVAGDKYYAMGNQVQSGVGAATEVTVENGTLVTTGVEGWHVQVLDEDGTVTLSNKDGKYLLRAKSSSNLDLGGSAANWTMAKDVDGYYTITNKNGDARYLSYNGTGFKAYAAASDSRFIQFMLLPLAEPTPEPEPEPEPEKALETGCYVVVAVAGDRYYAMSNAPKDAYSIQAAEVSVASGAITSAYADYWNVTVLDDSGSIYLQTADGQYLSRASKSSNISLGSTAVTWKAEKNENGYYTITNQNGDARYLSYNGTAFKAYAAANATRFVEFMLIPATAKPVTEATTGTYMVLTKHQGQYYAMTHDSDGYLMRAAQVQSSGDGFAVSPELAWELTVSADGQTATLGFEGSYLTQTSKSSANVSLKDAAFEWKLTYDEAKASFRLQSTTSTRYLMFTTGNGGSFKVYASADENKAQELILVKLS